MKNCGPRPRSHALCADRRYCINGRRIRAPSQGHTANGQHAPRQTGKGQFSQCDEEGRHRYFRLSNRDVAQVLEKLALIAPPTNLHSLNETLERKAIHRARTCYDHLAGELGVGWTQALIDKGFIRRHDEVYEITQIGENRFHTFVIDCLKLQRKRRAFARACQDWSERKPHIAGTLGAAILQRSLELKWIARLRGSRAIKVTEAGRDHLRKEFGLEWK